MNRPSALALLFVLVFAAAASGVEVKLTVAETDGVARSPAAITTGVPFARGVVRDVAALSLSAGGRPIPAQFTRTVPWPDGSVRWALLDTQVDVAAGGRAELVVSDAAPRPAPASPVRVTEAAGSVTVSTGPLEFVIDRSKGPMFASLSVDGKPRLSGGGLVVYKDGGGQVAAGPPDELTIELAGPMRAVVCLRGKFPGAHRIGGQDLLTYTVRIAAFAGQRSVKVHAWLENNGAMGYHVPPAEGPSPKTEWFAFDGMAVELGLALGDAVTAACEGVRAAGNIKVLQVCSPPETDAKPPAKPRQPPFYTWDDFRYTITSTGKELKTGARTDGVLALAGSAGAMTAAVRDFWQNYEKAVELDGGTLRLWLWPTEGQWPRKNASLNRPLVGDGGDLDPLHRDGVYFLPGAVHKGHELLLDFSGRPTAEASAELSAPLMAVAPAEYYAATEAAPGLFAPPDVRTGNRDCDVKLDAWMRSTRSAADPQCPGGLFQARRTSRQSSAFYVADNTYWYGWMDFGDIPAIGAGPTCLHYDWTWIMLANAMRTGDAGFLRLGTDMARHRIDVDQLWSDRDLPRLAGLQRGDKNIGSFHCAWLCNNWITHMPDPSNNWLAGVALYYMLTGEPKALECCRRNVRGLEAAWKQIAEAKPWRGPQTDMAANAWSMSCYCAMYDLTAEKRWLDDAIGLFRDNVVARWKADGTFLHNPQSQIAQQSYIKDDQKYCFALQSFCELHHLTGDAELFKLLKEATEKEFPDTFFDAPVYLADLYAYVGLVEGNAELMEQGADLFAQGFPESKQPPVFLPDSPTWSFQGALMLRCGNLLQYAFWKQRAKPQ